MKKALIFLFVVLIISRTANANKLVSIDAVEKLIPLHEIKRPPGPYDWLAQHREAGKLFLTM